MQRGRHYIGQFPPPPPVVHNCPECRRKFKTESKLQIHVEQRHYYKTQTTPTYYQFNGDEQRRVLMAAQNYRIMLQGNQAIPYHALLPQGGTVTPEFVELQETFRQRILNAIDRFDWLAIVKDFERFLNMGIPYYDTNFCPSLPIDFLWHAVMVIEPQWYHELCQKCCGRLIPHCAELRTEEQDQKRFAYFREVYKHLYHVDITVSDGAKMIPNSIMTSLDALDRRKREEDEQEAKRVDKIRRREEAQAAELARFNLDNDMEVKDYWTYKEYYLPAYNSGLREYGLMLAAQRAQRAARQSVQLGGSC